MQESKRNTAVLSKLENLSEEHWHNHSEKLHQDDRCIANCDIAFPIKARRFVKFRFLNVTFKEPLDAVEFDDCELQNVTFGRALTEVTFKFTKPTLARISAKSQTWTDVSAQNARFVETKLLDLTIRGMDLVDCTFENSSLHDTSFDFPVANDGTTPFETPRHETQSTINAAFVFTNLTSTKLFRTKLRSVHFQYSLVDENTLFYACSIDSQTTSTGTPFRSARIPFETLTDLARNNRQRSLEIEIEKATHLHWWWLQLVKLLWYSTNYGTSGKRLFQLSVFGWSLACATVAILVIFAPPQFEGLSPPTAQFDSWGVFLVGVAYFVSITLTTLGYGDITPLTVEARSLSLIMSFAGYFVFAALASRLAAVLQD